MEDSPDAARDNQAPTHDGPERKAGPLLFSRLAYRRGHPGREPFPLRPSPSLLLRVHIQNADPDDHAPGVDEKVEKRALKSRLLLLLREATVRFLN